MKIGWYQTWGLSGLGKQHYFKGALSVCKRMVLPKQAKEHALFGAPDNPCSKCTAALLKGKL